MTKMRAPTEKELQGMVMDYWRSFGTKGSRVAAIPNAWAFGQPGLTGGLPDLLCYGGPILQGRTLYIELKTPKGKLSKSQENIRAEMKAMGVPHFVCDNFDDVADFLVHYGICRPIKADAA